jgi:phosphoribosyl-ATP pyrophosphohydrolase
MSDTRIERLQAVIRERKTRDPSNSYVASLFAKGREKIAQKVGEEATETVIAALSGDSQKLVSESADLLFHLIILLEESEIDFEAILNELERREGVSGHVEKANRKG